MFTAEQTKRQETTLLTAQEVAERLGFSRISIYRLAQSGTLPSVRIGRSLRFKNYVVEEVAQHGLRVPSRVS